MIQMKYDSLKDAQRLIDDIQEGQICVIGKDGKEKLYKKENGKLVQQKGGQINAGSLYDWNKQVINSLGVATKDSMKKFNKAVKNFQDRRNSQYYMLLFRDISYYTVFAVKIGEVDCENLSTAVEECILGIGSMYNWDNTEDDFGIEIWVKPEGAELPVVGYLFPYDSGIVTIGD